MSHLVENNILSENGLRVLSLFDGISCGRIALDRAGFKVKDYYAYEIEQNAIKISRYNYPSIHQCGDVFEEDFNKYKGIDLLIGGSPCTEFSSAKCSKTAKHKREVVPGGDGWKLFMQYVRALHESKPKYFLYENNYGIADSIRDAITKELCVEPVLLDSQLVSAQRRKRLYWTNIPIKGEPEDKGILVKDVIVNDSELIKQFDDRIRNTLVKCENYIKYDLSGKGHFSQQDRMYFLDNKAPTVSGVN